MLTEYDIDIIGTTASIENPITLYYAAHNVEVRENVLDELIYKSASDFKLIEINVTGVQNALFEYLDYKENTSGYFKESEKEWFRNEDGTLDYILRQYTVKENERSKFYFRTPSIIYGTDTTVYTHNEKEYKSETPSPIVPIYTNEIIILGNNDGDYNETKHKYKYRELSGDGFKYVTSNWYILHTANFYRFENPLITVGERCAYFMNKNDGIDYIEQLKA